MWSCDDQLYNHHDLQPKYSLKSRTACTAIKHVTWFLSWFPSAYKRYVYSNVHTINHLINSIEKVWNIATIIKMRNGDMKWASAVGKMVPMDLVVRPTNQQNATSVKHNKAKCNKTSNACITKICVHEIIQKDVHRINHERNGQCWVFLFRFITPVNIDKMIKNYRILL